jgi:predicted nucleic acid-binding protein
LDGYMFDTTEFNAVVDGELPLSAISGERLFATRVQLDEIDKTPCERRRAELHRTFAEVAAANLPTESAVWGVSKWIQAKWQAADSQFEAMLACLKALDQKGEKRHRNQLCDILIAETAIRNGLILVSGDRILREVTRKFGGHAIDREEFMLATGH